jgi:hypothetical protein
LYGWVVAEEVLIWAPNVIGLVFAVAQLALFGLYGVHTPQQEKSKESVPLV